MAGLYAVTLQLRGKKKVVQVVEYSHSRAEAVALYRNNNALYASGVSFLRYVGRDEESAVRARLN